MSATFAPQSSLITRVRKPLSLPKSRRILRSSEFREIYKAGARMSCRYFAAFCLYRSGECEEPAKAGFTVPRALGKAVVRNRIKRRMRAAVRSQLSLLRPNWSIVFNPRRSVLEAPFQELCRETARVFTRCNEQ